MDRHVLDANWRKRQVPTFDDADIRLAMTKTFPLANFWRVLLREMGLSPERLARRAGLAGDLFAHHPTLVTVAEFEDLWQALEAEIDRPNLALELGQALSLDMFDPALFACFCSTNLQAAVARLQVYKRLTGPCWLDVQATEVDLRVACHVHGLPLPPPLWGMGEVAVWVRMVRHATRTQVRPLVVTMPVRPRDGAAWADFLGVEVSEGPSYAVTFSSADALLPFLTGDSGMWQGFEPTLKWRLDALEPIALGERVGRELLELLPARQAQADRVAGRLGVSRRTLQRKLRAEGTPFRAVLEQTRKRLALHYLRNTELRVEEVAFLLGYDDPTSFYPAFRRWTGSTPEQTRSR